MMIILFRKCLTDSFDTQENLLVHQSNAIQLHSLVLLVFSMLSSQAVNFLPVIVPASNSPPAFLFWFATYKRLWATKPDKNTIKSCQGGE